MYKSLCVVALLVCSCAGDEALPDAAGGASRASDALHESDQCTPEELDHWDGRIGACSGTWSYSLYECFQLKRSAACPVESYEKKPIMGVVPTEHPDHGVATWSRALKEQRRVQEVRMLAYQNEITREAKARFGREALATSEIVSGDLAALSSRVFPAYANNEFNYEEVYFFKVGEGEWGHQATHRLKMRMRDAPMKQHHVMANARGNLGSEAFGYTQLAIDLPQHLWNPDRNREYVVEVAFYRPLHFHKKLREDSPQQVVGYADDPTRPIYAECRHDSHGREPKNFCGAPETPVTSAANLFRAELPQEHSYAYKDALCSTLDALENEPHTAQFRALYAASTAGGTTLGTRRLAAKKAKHLYERHAGDLTEADHATAVALYGENVGTNACGNSGALSATSPQVGLVDLCHRMSLAHASIDAVKANVRRCMPRQEALSGLASAERSFYLARLEENSYAMLDRYFAEEARPGSPLCEDGGSAGLELIDTWFAAATARSKQNGAGPMRDTLATAFTARCLEEL